MNATQFSSFLNGISKKPLYVLDKAIPLNQYTPINLSETNPDLLAFNVSNSQDWETYLDAYLQNNQSQVAYGGYAEKRNIYKRSSYFNVSHKDLERNIHLGIDLWLAVGSCIYAPLDGTIHSYANNVNHGDYGPTIILKHTIKDGVFYSLYGHLSLESINNLTIGQAFKAGDCLATLGDAKVNGDYAPHLHFQIIRDIGNYKGDYPGVTSQKDLQFYLNNCPDPNLLLKLP
ncbi:peptidoglycan DD-metalloendopeptidase family protein [Hanstruepera marina]|uniref:peptidoglycan DD-metalloendopeptidase family protein n=1 Tax=Hanstruepera marina TaxID=2873265 RepID=UPI001CA75007|nr:peptidoglycan DD-metalloendopeptidase family protein [Hanstruepera marina]